MSQAITDRRPGRPRSVAADRAILDAALELFAATGLDGVTVEGVAARAGVGKATIYRRYPCKVDLVIAAARTVCAAESPDPDTGSVDDDLRVIARGLARMLTRTVAGRAMLQLVADLRRNDDMRRAHADFIACRRATVATVVRRGIARGELRADTDAELIADLVAGPIFYRHLVSGQRLDAAFADRVVDAVLAGRRPAAKRRRSGKTN